MYGVTIIIIDFTLSADLHWNIGKKLNFSSQKVPHIRISLIKEGTDVSDIYCKIQDHTVKIFFQKLYSDF